MTSADALDPRTPVIVGVGQVAERIEDPGYRALSPAALAIEAASNAMADTGADVVALGAAIDTLAAVRQFDISTPISSAPFGRSTNIARSIAAGIGADPTRAILEVVGGQGPQHLIGELGTAIRAGESEVAMIVGSEAISTARRIAAAEEAPDWSEDPGGSLEDRGYGLRGVVTLDQVRHGLLDAPLQYSLLEHARRARLGLSRDDYAMTMGELFEPLSVVAAANPLSAAPEARTARELVEITERNRRVTDPYPKFLVARDQVNQGAAVLMMSIAVARRLGVPEDRWVFVHGQADLTEKSILDRPDLGAYPAGIRAIEHALAMAGISVDDLAAIDLYSCFPVAVSSICDGLDLAANDPRGLTVTGGLPYFGGPGNNYATHAIAEVVARMRSSPGTYGLVGANGGMLSKYSVGVYSSTAVPWPSIDPTEAQAQLDAVHPAPSTITPEGWATIETYTVTYGRTGSKAVVVGRLEATGARFLANPAEGDDEVLALLTGAEEPIGARIFVRSFGYGNRVTRSREKMDALLPRPALGLRDAYEHILVRRDGHVLEVTLNRPTVRNALHAEAHVELEQVFDSYFADPDLWVAIITGAGDDAFCSGNDLTATNPAGLPWFPRSGFGGLTSRDRMIKPVIAAVNGAAMGGGFEIVLACQLAVADESARFALPEVKVGLYAAAGGVVRLPRAIPSKIAHELILTGRTVESAEALSLGLVTRVVPKGSALESARMLAAQIVAVSPTSVRLSLQVIDETRGIADEVDAVSQPTDALDQLLISEDAMEGIMAFAEKRAPEWKNR